MNRRQRAEYLEMRIADEIVLLEEELNNGISEGYLDLLELYRRLHTYSPGNCVPIAMQCLKAWHCAGFRTREAMGDHVRKGEQAIWVRADAPEGG